MNDDQFFPALEGYRLEWESGVYRSVIDAFELCALNGLRMPPWLRHAVMSDLFFAYQNRPRGDEKWSRHGEAEDREAERHVTRYRVVKMMMEEQEWDLAIGSRKKAVSKAEAARDAAQLLVDSKSDARGEPRVILLSYERVATGDYKLV